MSHALIVESVVRAALLEDLGLAGDLTTDAIVPVGAKGTAWIAARDKGRVAGMEAAALAFRLLDPAIVFDVRHGDGEAVEAGSILAEVRGETRALLTGERTALNFLGRLCGIATATAELVELVKGTNAKIVCTRKTTPGLRSLEKHAIRMGGGSNHRFALDDAVMIKDNHIAAAGGIHQAIKRVRARVGHMVKIEVEVDTLDQLRDLLDDPVDVVLLDNMSVETLAEAVDMVSGLMLTEASGNINKDTIRAVAETGVDMISVGRLTHSVKNFDVGLDM